MNNNIMAVKKQGWYDQDNSFINGLSKLKLLFLSRERLIEQKTSIQEEAFHQRLIRTNDILVQVDRSKMKKK